MSAPTAHLNAIGTAVPEHDVHGPYIDYARTALGDTHDRRLFERLIARAQIDHRYAVVPLDYYGGALPDTAARMTAYEDRAFGLAERAIAELDPAHVAQTTHLIVTSCTGFYAPGIDIHLIRRFGLSASVERTIVGFMGCYAAVTALRLARQAVRSDPAARVLVVNLELCSLHLRPPVGLEEAMGFAIFADGCAASLVSGDPAGISLDAFTSTLIPDSAEEITWRVGALGFDMRLSFDVPRKIGIALRAGVPAILGGTAPEGIDIWAVHPGGRAILDAVGTTLGLAHDALDHSRDVLRDFGNMSSATIVFVLERILAAGRARGGSGCALAFGPGMMCETMRFSVVA